MSENKDVLGNGSINEKWLFSLGLKFIKKLLQSQTITLKGFIPIIQTGLWPSKQAAAAEEEEEEEEEEVVVEVVQKIGGDRRGISQTDVPGSPTSGQEPQLKAPAMLPMLFQMFKSSVHQADDNVVKKV